MVKVWRVALCVALVCGAALGCGEDVAETPAPNKYPALKAAEPLALGAAVRGVGVRHGELLAFSFNAPDGVKRAVMGAGAGPMLHIQAYDELTQEFGEYTFYTPPSSMQGVRRADAFLTQPELGRAVARTADLDRELDEALMRAGAVGWDKRGVVVNFWRNRRDWFVRWDGLLGEQANRVGKGNYGFGRRAMVEDLLGQLEQIARTQQPVRFIVGDEVELLFATDSGGGISPAEFSNFLSFYQEAVRRIKAASPNTRVGMGIHWDRFATRVARLYAADGATVDNAALDAAFTAIMLPILDRSDLIALRSYANPSDEVPNHYQFLRRLPNLYGVELPVVWYAVGSPTESGAGELRQKNYLEDFAAWNAGVNVEAVYWDRLLNIDGANGSNQQVGGRCEALISMDKGFLVPRARCFDGLFDTLFQIKSAGAEFLK
jgi:hypothetical protein